MKNIKKFLEQVAEKADINFNSVGKNGETDFYVEFEYWSDLGEDCIIPLVVENLTKEEITHAMYKYQEDFDAEEHATELFNLHGAYGTPTSLRALLKDADEQQEQFTKIYEIMRELA